MDPNTAKNWTLNTYSDEVWTDVVAEPSITANFSIANTSTDPVTVSVRLSDGSGNNLARIVPEVEIAPGNAHRIDLRALAVTGSQSLQVWADAPGIEVIVSGAVEGDPDA